MRLEKEETMIPGRHICTVCNNIYEDPAHSGCGCSSDFASLPDDWKCPECGADKDKYQPCSCVSVDSKAASCQVHSNV